MTSSTYEKPSTNKEARFKLLNEKYKKKDSQDNHLALYEFMQ